MHADRNQTLHPILNSSKSRWPKRLGALIAALTLIIAVLYFTDKQLGIFATNISEPQSNKVLDKIDRKRAPLPPERLARLKRIAAPQPTTPNSLPHQKSTNTETAELPKLEDSDKPAKESISALISEPMISGWIIDQFLIEKFVALVDNMARGQLPGKLLPFKQPEKPFTAITHLGELRLDPASYSRFNAFAQMIDGVDIESALDQYQHFYPLLQQAYSTLGYPDQSFHHRLVRAVNLILQTPDINGEIKLIQPGVRYKYLDENIERLTAVEKQLIRMGPKNIQIIKSRLEHLSLGLATFTH